MNPENNDVVAAQHVDVFLTDWSHGHQSLVARILPNGTIIVHAPDYAGWFSEKPTELDGTEVEWSDLPRLHACFRGSYSGATEPHTDAECKFVPGKPLPFTVVV